MIEEQEKAYLSIQFSCMRKSFPTIFLTDFQLKKKVFNLNVYLVSFLLFFNKYCTFVVGLSILLIIRCKTIQLKQ